MDDFITVSTNFSLAEAEAQRLALEAEGIPALATDETIGSMLGSNTVGGIKLQVAAKDAVRAKEFLATLNRESHSDSVGDADPDDGISLKCSSCGAEIWFPSDRRGHSETCPECGSQFDVPA